MLLQCQFLFYEETVRVAPSLGSEDGKDEAEKEGEQGKPNYGQDPPFAHIPFTVPGLRKHDHSTDN